LGECAQQMAKRYTALLPLVVGTGGADGCGCGLGGGGGDNDGRAAIAESVADELGRVRERRRTRERHIAARARLLLPPTRASV